MAELENHDMEAAALWESLADCMTEIQTAHHQIDCWNFGIPFEVEGRALSLSERIADLCLRLERAERERDEARTALAGAHKVQQALVDRLKKEI